MICSSFWEEKRILVTGHTGFKGSWLITWLIEMGASVWGYSLEPEMEPNLYSKIKVNLKDKCFSNLYGDINDFSKLKEFIKEASPDIVFHLAAQPLVLKSYEKPIYTWQTNVMGSINLLESLRDLEKKCAVVMVTTDKVYKNKEWNHGYRENDELGGHDPYSASKAAAELAIQSWRKSFCNFGNHHENLKIATVRSGNVIGGGDWSTNRLVPDAVKSLSEKKPILIRNPNSTRPWQHVLEPLFGYMLLAKNLYINSINLQTSFNFGPRIENNKSVDEFVDHILKIWPGIKINDDKKVKLHEAKLLYLSVEKAYQKLKWEPLWDFTTTVDKTISWYKKFYDGEDPFTLCMKDIKSYMLNQKLKI